MIIPSKIYDKLKWVLMIVVPALITLITGAGVLYGFDTKIIVGTITLIATFVGAITGISSVNYNKTQS